MLYEERVARGYYAEQRRYGAVFAYKSTVGTLATKCNRLAKRYVRASIQIPSGAESQRILESRLDNCSADFATISCLFAELR